MRCLRHHRRRDWKQWLGMAAPISIPGRIMMVRVHSPGMDGSGRRIIVVEDHTDGSIPSCRRPLPRKVQFRQFLYDTMSAQGYILPLRDPISLIFMTRKSIRSPDLQNLLQGVIGCMDGTVLRDDSQIERIHAEYLP